MNKELQYEYRIRKLKSALNTLIIIFLFTIIIFLMTIIMFYRRCGVI